ncbi:MAG: glycosyltransferase family 2 protein [Verrucomicrobiae bacterium]|nr:glycosyltransferase family 2 protein [Verrucomicrobiae bacterium]
MTALFVLTLGLWCAGWLLLGRMKSCSAANSCVPRLGSSTAPETLANTLSIIIPARNEEHNLPRLLRSISAQSIKPREIIVVDDGSTDRTAEVALQCGAKVIASQRLPDGWRGKTWACHQGAQAASGDLLMFMDADTWFEPDGLSRVLTEFVAQPSGRPEHQENPQPERRTNSDFAPYCALSVGPFHNVRKLYEELSLFFNLSMVAGTLPRGLFGQMLLVDRQSYRRAGGHESVKGKTLENVFLAEQFRLAGIPTRSVTGRGVIAVRMYPNGLRELVEGWTKGFATGAARTPRKTLVLVASWLTGLALAPIGWAATGNHIAWGLVYLACAAQVWAFARLLGSFRWCTALLYPVPLLFFFVVFTRAKLRSGKPVNWKGRIIHAD